MNYLLFTTPEGAYRLRLDLAWPAERIAEESLLVPDADTDTAWIVGCCEPRWFAPFDGRSGEAGERTDIEAGFGWPAAGYRGGLLFLPVDTGGYGPISHWPVRGAPEPFDLPIPSETRLQAVVGDLAVLISPGPVLTIVDMQAGEPVSSLSFDEVAHEGNVTGLCASPDGTYVALTSRDSIEIWEAASGAVVGGTETDSSIRAGGWVAAGQFAFLTDSHGETRLKIIDAASPSAVNIARLAAPGDFRVATTGPPC